mgnify:CR=1 FL=1
MHLHFRSLVREITSKIKIANFSDLIELEELISQFQVF